jgi:nitroreductase
MTSRDIRPTLAATIALVIGSSLSSACWYRMNQKEKDTSSSSPSSSSTDTITAATANNVDDDDENNLSVLACIRNRRSVFPSGYLKDPPPLDDSIIQSLLDAAIWAPFHGKCYAGCQHPAKFVVLGKQPMVEMQNMTLQYYDRNWKEVGWGAGNIGGTQEEYDAWRSMTHDEMTGRWAPCSHMIAIVMRRQTGPKRLPEWEEAAAVAAATQNMHIQSTKFPQLACYWSSWHDAARDSDEMKEFLNMEPEDKCLGFFIVAQRDTDRCFTKDRRKRDKSLMVVEWRK